MKLHAKLRLIFLRVFCRIAGGQHFFFYFRFESGHSTDVEIQHCPFMPDMFPLRYLIHGTNEKNLDSIRRLGLLPGGTRVAETTCTLFLIQHTQLQYSQGCFT